jgi:hypothetical protein
MVAGARSSAPRTVEEAQLGLGESRRRVDAQVRRAHRFSWLSWGFLFALAFGEVLLVIFELVFPVVTSNGTSYSSTSPFWGPFAAFAPAVVVLALAIRELFLGRREAREVSPAGPPKRPEPGIAPTWIEEVRDAQARLTRGASEIEWSFVPLVLGFIAFAEAGVSLAADAAGLPGSVTVFLVASVGGLVLGVAPVWPLYRVARQWIRAGQERLELQSRELARLEAEFLWRFAGAGPTS